jgi:hypothetical protein
MQKHRVESRRWPLSAVYTYEMGRQEWVLRSREAVVSAVVTPAAPAARGPSQRVQVVVRDMRGGPRVAANDAVAGAVARGDLASVRIRSPDGTTCGRFAILRFPSPRFAIAFTDFLNASAHHADERYDQT